jgi:DNA-directed RNA polymerase specialized sigma24 family protein
MWITASKKNWNVTPSAFHRLLEWIDRGDDSHGQRYLMIRDRLIGYFDRKNCSTPEDLADETLNRVTRRLEEEGEIVSDPPEKYFYTVARFVFHEYLRTAGKESEMCEQMVQHSHRTGFPAQEAVPDRAKKEEMLNCLEKCTAKLDSLNRKIILSYYIGKERVKIDHRRALASELGVTANALTIRACRIREKLEKCVRECIGKG